MSRLSVKQREALRLLHEHTGDASEPYIHSGTEVISDGGQPAIGFRTAFALQRRGLVVIEDPWSEYPYIGLTDAGRAAASSREAGNG